MIDGIVPEPAGGAHEDAEAAALLLRDVVVSHLAELDGIEPAALRRARRAPPAALRSAALPHRLAGLRERFAVDRRAVYAA